MNYLDILKKSFKIVKANKYLWVLGLFAGSGFALFNPGGNFSTLLQDKNSNIKSFLGKNTLGHFFMDFGAWLRNHWIILSVVALIFLVFILSLVILAILSKIGLIYSVSEISEDKKTILRK